MTSSDRALGALYGLAIGDAMGMPTQELTRLRAEELLGAEPRFLPGPPDNPISADLPAASVTDDTEQAVLLGQLLIAGRGAVDPVRFAAALLEWEARMAARGSLDLLGPSTRSALASVAGGADPTTTGRHGTTDGAAMRITPIGIAVTVEDLVAAVVAANRVTHDTGVANAGAAAVAAVVSLGVSGSSFAAAIPGALTAARAAARFGGPPAGAVAERIEAALAVAGDGPTRALDVVLGQVADLGTSLATEDAVPAAFAVAALAPHDAWRAAWYGARLGGDADTIAALAGAMVGATTGLSRLPASAVRDIDSVNRLGLPELARGLLAIRAGGTGV